MYEFINVKELKRICSDFVSVGLFHLGVCSKSCERLNCLIKNPELQFRVLSALFILNCTVLTDCVHMRLKLGETPKSRILTKLGWIDLSMG